MGGNVRIIGVDVGTTSIGFSFIEHDREAGTGSILRMGARIFPEARDPKGTPLNQQRRLKRMMRRQVRRRRLRRKLLNETLAAAGLLPPYNSPEWKTAMEADPYALRKAGVTETNGQVEKLTAHELGRALYHLAKRRHFQGRELEEPEEDGKKGSEKPDGDEADEKAANDEREATLATLKQREITLGAWLAERGPHERKRGVHAHRTVVEAEFDALWQAQKRHHAILNDPAFRISVESATFAQRPVFWRKSTLGECALMPGSELCPKGAWLSQQRRMLEKLNNLAIAGGNARPLDAEERAAILEKLQGQGSMTWAGVRALLKPLYKARGEPGLERRIKFNLEQGGDSKLLGNPLESKLEHVFGDAWPNHPHRQAIRDTIHESLWSADYGEVGTQRVVIRSPAERRRRRAQAVEGFVNRFGATPEQAAALGALTLQSGWEPFSIEALRRCLPELEAGHRFGALLRSPEWDGWRRTNFPDRDQPTGEVLDRLPSPADPEEQQRIAGLRNPTVVRVQNELRKVINNLIGLYGKPDLIRVELAREVGKSKREREEMQAGLQKQERRRKEAARDLESKGIANPSRRDIEKWMLWQECGQRCPYTNDHIGFEPLFRNGEFDIEHIWPRRRSLDDSFRNKTLCRRDVNIAKGDRTPFEYFSGDAEAWSAVKARLDGMIAKKGGPGMSPGKAKKFLAESIPDDFSSRQLNDTGYAARQIVAMLARLWPDVENAPVAVQAVSGRVTAQLRKLWQLNNILADDGEKTRADHRHHAVDALAVACAHPGVTNQLSQYWQRRDLPGATRPELPLPWPTIRADATQAVGDIVVSHKVRKKVSGPLHKETTYGDTGQSITKSGVEYRVIVERVKVSELTLADLAADDLQSSEYIIVDKAIREALRRHVDSFGGDIKKAMATTPTFGPGGPPIRKVRLRKKQQMKLLTPMHNGVTDPESKHHVAIYLSSGGKYEYQVVSLFEAAQRISKRSPVVSPRTESGAQLVMSLSKGDTLTLDDPRARFWVVREVKSNGQLALVPHTDARPTKQAKMFSPTVPGLLKLSAVKLSIDPIGRIRRAGR